jgi:hypothetical protein
MTKRRKSRRGEERRGKNQLRNSREAGRGGLSAFICTEYKQNTQQRPEKGKTNRQMQTDR